MPFRQSEYVGAAELRFKQIWADCQRLLVRGNRVRVPLEEKKHIAATEPGLGEIRPQRQGAIECRQGVVVAIDVIESISPVEPCLGKVRH